MSTLRNVLTASVGSIVLFAGASTVASAQTPATITVALTQPATGSSVSGSAPNLTCSVNTTAKTYVVRIPATTVNGVKVTGTLTVARYFGPGTYSGAATLTVIGSDGTTGSAAGTKVTVTVTETGGSSSFSQTATGARAPKTTGKTLAGTLSWTCPIA